ncbi:hypothetical protein OIU74_007924 [Salix koriyanagi]|uniref:Uncharacterized protein n=1 Tax=Salix koriyanagi TaxID=2511006 RepID=A0A9Q0Z6U2_9ROSI|nr:hypothetical protein OIU74_007924 [Salix koriyanagi]
MTSRRAQKMLKKLVMMAIIRIQLKTQKLVAEMVVMIKTQMLKVKMLAEKVLLLLLRPPVVMEVVKRKRRRRRKGQMEILTMASVVLILVVHRKTRVLPSLLLTQLLPMPLMISQNPPQPHVYPYPPMHYPPPPAYGINYNTAYPSASESFYAQYPMHDHIQYYQNRYQPPPPPSDPINDQFGDDDNETGCSVM